ncbi:LysR family transcriptional regulator [Rhizobium brockwellii]|uniref:LysR family transcriptional regulator n=1 Tax=Rhizobium brockwellii TaxID=3019932 RepID=UPI003F9C87BF
MPAPTLNDLKAFTAVAAHRSFRKAADELGLSASTLSHVVRTLEKNLGVRLLNRSTRSVAVTEAGERLLVRLGPTLHELQAALDEVTSFGERPRGNLRINANETAARLLLQTVVPIFLRRYPDATLDLVTEGRLVDIVEEGFDAGIRLGEALPQDMIAVRFGGDVRFLAVASPEYLASRPVPSVPEDLKNHDCIRVRLPSGKLYRWEFEQRGREMTVDVPGALTLDHIGLMVESAVEGLGIAYVPERAARADLDESRLTIVLEDWCPSIPGLHLYYPGRRHVSPLLKAFIEVLREGLP